MGVLGVLLLIGGIHVRDLGSSSYSVRELAQGRLASYQELAVPSLLAGSRSKDLEQRRRSKELLLPVKRRYSRVAAKVFMCWAVYGPNDDAPAELWYGRRSLGVANTHFFDSLDIDVREELREAAISLGMMKADEYAYYRYSEEGCSRWINDLRNSAYGR